MVDPEEEEHMNVHYHGTEKVVTIDKRTGWYFAQSEFCYERYGPYDAVSPGLIMQEFERDTGMRAQIGDRIYLDGKLKELTEGAPPQIIAGGSQAEKLMQKMVSGKSC